MRTDDGPAEGALEARTGWIQSVRHLKSRTYFDVRYADRSVGQVVLDGASGMQTIRSESYVRILGRPGPQGFHAEEVILLGDVHEAWVNIRPSRLPGDLGTHSVAAVLARRHLYLRAPELIANMRFRAEITRWIRDWFERQGIIEFAAPILTPLTLYEPDTALVTELGGSSVFLTQCVGYYMEAAVHAIGDCYNMGPSFRGAESKSRRHLAEYWHVKAELLEFTRHDLMSLVTSMLREVVQHAVQLPDEIGGARCTAAAVDLQEPPAHVTYDAARSYLNGGPGFHLGSEESLSTAHERAIIDWTGRPTWVVGTPASTESPRYRVDPTDARGTRALVADLILPKHYGELVGVAEKVSDFDEWCSRRAQNTTMSAPTYDWLNDLHTVGAAPHGGFGMGLERLLCWLAGGHHVRDFVGFPRIHGRSVYP